MELFATLNVCRMEDQQAIERIMTSRDKRWLASLGLKGSRTFQVSNNTECDEHDAEQADPDTEMAALEEEMMGMAINTRMKYERPQALTLQLIRDNIALFTPIKHQTRSPQVKPQELDAIVRKKVLRIDWLDIGKIENLNVFTHVEELYLQYNLIETIEGLNDHRQLKLLALAGNRIREVKNLKHLSNLKFLDLSMNYIDQFDVSEFPRSLRVLRIAGNPFVRHTPAYVHFIFERLPNLVEVDHIRRMSLHEGSPKHAPCSARSSTGSETSASHNQAVVLPLPVPRLPIDQYRALQVEVELPQHEQDRLEKQEAESMAAFDLIDTDNQRYDQMLRWKLQLTDLTSRTREQLAKSVQIGMGNSFCETRTRTLS